MPSGHPNPTTREVERQLEQMLADDAFSSRPQQAKLFEFVVRAAMRGEEVTEKYIREKVFPSPPYKPESNIARGTIDLVKRILADYYAGDGKDDPVIIALPRSPEGKRIKFQAGHAYKPLFSYNPRHAIAQEFALVHHLLRGTPSQITDALLHLGNVAEIEPEHPDMIVAGVEAIAIQMLLGTFADDREVYLTACFDSLNRVVPFVSEQWRIRAARGLLHCAQNKFDEARQEYTAALALDRESTEASEWYPYFLFRTGQEAEAVQLKATHAAENTADAGTHAAHGILLCHMSRFEEAERALRHALELDRNFWTAHYGMTLLYEATGRHEAALDQSEQLRSLVECEDFEVLMRQLGIEPRKR